MPNGRCYVHGGKTPSGVASPHFKNGRHSKVLPTRLAAQYETAQRDPDLLNLKHEIALVDARLGELLERIDLDGAGALWGMVSIVHHAMNQAIDTDDLDELKTLVDQLGTAISRASADRQAWEAILPVVEQRRRLVQSESRRRVAMQDMMTTERSLVLLGAVAQIVKRHVHDRDVLAGIAAELRGLVGDGAGGPAQPGP
jgi:hypothetical protein